MARRRMLSKSQIEFSGPGQSFVGRYKMLEYVPYAGEKTLLKYTFENEIGTFILMGSMQIDQAMEAATEGDMIEVTYKGTAPTSSGFTVKLFDIAVLEEGPSGDIDMDAPLTREEDNELKEGPNGEEREEPGN